MLTKITVEAALNAELDNHLGFAKHENANTNNSRNSYSSKIIQTEAGQFELSTPRDHNGEFEPELVKKTSVNLRPWMARSFSLMLRVYQRVTSS